MTWARSSAARDARYGRSGRSPRPPLSSWAKGSPWRSRTRGVEPSDPVEIGRVVAPHGRCGTLRVRATGSGRHLRQGVEPFVADRRRRISRVQQTPKGFLIDLEDVKDRSEADDLTGKGLVLDRQELDAPEEDEFYIDDLVGLTTLDEAGQALGIVEMTFETPAHEVLVIF